VSFRPLAGSEAQAVERESSRGVVESGEGEEGKKEKVLSLGTAEGGGEEESGMARMGFDFLYLRRNPARDSRVETFH
jgi:hypothetical protein